MNEELDVKEVRQLISPNSYDDNFNLVKYTAELRNNNDNSFFAFVDFNENGEGVTRECPHCLEYEIHNRLGPKIKKKDELPAPDDDQFMSCYECGSTFPAYETFAESQIKDSLETVNNPFENSESVFLSTDSRATTRRKRENKDGYRRGVHKYMHKRIDYAESEDPDIQREIDKHGSDNVHIIQ